MAAVFLSIGVLAVFVLAFLVDISINLRRLDGNIKKMIKSYDNVHGSVKS